MNLILHIFRKDARHLYPEIAIMLLFTVAFAWVAPMQWLFVPYGGVFFGGGVASVLAALLRVFLPVIWLVLITRVVHDEVLVGDRQFWVTRPYTWPVLLAAKLLFLAVFLYLPLILMQIYLLHHAGLDVRAALPDLLYYQLRLTAIGFLPVFAIATVTATFARQFVTVLAYLAYLGLVSAAGTNLMGWRMVAPGVNTACALVAAGVLLWVVVLQYARRRTRASRLVLAGLPVLLLVIVVAAPAKMLIERAYSMVGNGDGVQFNTSPLEQQPGSGGPLTGGGKVTLLLPVTATGLPAGARLKVTAGLVEIVAKDGFRWSSPYQSTGTDVSGEHPHSAMMVPMPRNVFNRIMDTPVTMSVTLVGQRYQTTTSQSFTLEEPDFAVPGRGICPVRADGIVGDCLYPLRMPPPTGISATVSDKLCMESGTKAVVQTFVASDQNFIAYDFDPVTTSRPQLEMPGERSGMMSMGFLCPGSPVTLTPRALVGLERISFSQQGLILAPYVRRAGMGMRGVVE